jgi:hypothetical protein
MEQHGQNCGHLELGMVAYNHNPTTWDVEIRKIEVGGQPGKKLPRPHLNK